MFRIQINVTEILLIITTKLYCGNIRLISQLLWPIIASYLSDYSPINLLLSCEYAETRSNLDSKNIVEVLTILLFNWNYILIVKWGWVVILYGLLMCGMNCRFVQRGNNVLRSYCRQWDLLIVNVGNTVSYFRETCRLLMWVTLSVISGRLSDC